MAIDVFGATVPKPGKIDAVAAFCVGLMRLIMPAILLAALYIFSFYLLQVPLGLSLETENILANPAWWMTWGHLSLAVAFFAVALTNRAHGPGMAFGQVLMAWAIMAGLLAFAVSADGLHAVLEELFPTKVMGAFLVALMAAHLVAIQAFDMQRGMPWWKAPLVAGIVAPLIFVLIFYPFSHPGMDAPWAIWMWMDFVAKAGMGILLLLPYNMMRTLVRPAPGLSGR